MATKKRPYWLCRNCGSRNERLKRKCLTCARAKPKKRVPAHAKTLRDDSYATYCEVAKTIHGVDDESCCVCSKPRSAELRHDRDHGHLKGDPSFGKPRGLACFRCNKLMPRELTPELAQLIAEYLLRVQAHYASRPDRAGRDKTSTGAE